jgi:hypothetical protein
MTGDLAIRHRDDGAHQAQGLQFRYALWVVDVIPVVGVAVGAVYGPRQLYGLIRTHAPNLYVSCLSRLGYGSVGGSPPRRGRFCCGSFRAYGGRDLDPVSATSEVDEPDLRASGHPLLRERIVFEGETPVLDRRDEGFILYPYCDLVLSVVFGAETASGNVPADNPERLFEELCLPRCDAAPLGGLPYQRRDRLRRRAPDAHGDSHNLFTRHDLSFPGEPGPV